MKQSTIDKLIADTLTDPANVIEPKTTAPPAPKVVPAEPHEALASMDWTFRGVTFPEPSVVMREGIRRAIVSVGTLTPLEQQHGCALRVAFLMDCQEARQAQRLNNYASYTASPTDEDYARARARIDAHPGFADACTDYVVAIHERFWSGPDEETTASDTKSAS